MGHFRPFVEEDTIVDHIIPPQTGEKNMLAPLPFFLETDLLQHPPRSRVGGEVTRMNAVETEMPEPVTDQTADRLSGIPVVPVRQADPVTQLRMAMSEITPQTDTAAKRLFPTIFRHRKGRADMLAKERCLPGNIIAGPFAGEKGEGVERRGSDLRHPGKHREALGIIGVERSQREPPGGHRRLWCPLKHD